MEEIIRKTKREGESKLGETERVVRGGDKEARKGRQKREGWRGDRRVKENYEERQH